MTLHRRHRNIVLVVSIAIALTIITIALIQATPQAIGSSWNGITIGVTNSSDVVKLLGSPTTIEHLDANTVVYRYETPNISYSDMYTITFQNNMVSEIYENLFSHYPRRTYLTAYLQKYGKPEHVLWSSQNGFGRILVWPKHGVLVWSTAYFGWKDDEVGEAYYFRPCSIECVYLKFHGIISISDPFAGSDVISGPKDAWGFTNSIFP